LGRKKNPASEEAGYSACAAAIQDCNIAVPPA